MKNLLVAITLTMTPLMASAQEQDFDPRGVTTNFPLNGPNNMTVRSGVDAVTTINSKGVSKYGTCNGDEACRKQPILGGACVASIGLKSLGNFPISYSGNFTFSMELSITSRTPIHSSENYHPQQKVADIVLQYRDKNGIDQKRLLKEIWSAELLMKFFQDGKTPDKKYSIAATNGYDPFGSFFVRFEEGDFEFDGSILPVKGPSDVKISFCNVGASFLGFRSGEAQISNDL
ncbi:MAG: hypothetical protein CL429_01850 [Acidimicrobiaceae bacterium]|nr:hypothetical protein [Acidimicrobiaceae bacterium]